jgi:hypothetical protein
MMFSVFIIPSSVTYESQLLWQAHAVSIHFTDNNYSIIIFCDITFRVFYILELEKIIYCVGNIIYMNCTMSNQETRTIYVIFFAWLHFYGTFCSALNAAVDRRSRRLHSKPLLRPSSSGSNIGRWGTPKIIYSTPTDGTEGAKFSYVEGATFDDRLAEIEAMGGGMHKKALSGCGSCFSCNTLKYKTFKESDSYDLSYLFVLICMLVIRPLFFRG